MTVISFSDHHILVEVREERNDGRVWFTCGIYGWPDGQNKFKTWDLMREMRAEVHGPIVFLGDFNEILWAREKEGGNARPEREMDAFRKCLNDCGLVDLGFRGRALTWSRGSQPSNLIREMLDRFLLV